jgi:hypothetical protein
LRWRQQQRSLLLSAAPIAVCRVLRVDSSGARG